MQPGVELLQPTCGSMNVKYMTIAVSHGDVSVCYPARCGTSLPNPVFSKLKGRVHCEEQTMWLQIPHKLLPE